MDILPFIEPIPTCHHMPHPPPTTLSLMTIPYIKKPMHYKGLRVRGDDI
jgi:hypothetical protein